jgi:hypothetical protein
MPKPKPFALLAAEDLNRVAGGGSRVSARTGNNNDQLVQMLTQVTSSIKDLANNKQSGMDPMMMMMMMMMGGGGGGGAQAAAAPAAPTPPPLPQVNVSIRNC